MQNDSSISHIAITCPHCGKHYKKVPYEAIKKYNFAFCKQCNSKFNITPEELEEALQRALNAAQGAAVGAGSQSATASTGAEQPGSSPYAAAPAGHEPLETPPGQVLPESAGPEPVTAQEPTPEEPPGAEDFLPAAAGAPQAPARETASLDQALEQKITDLAATMEETFSPPPAPIASDVTGDGAEELRKDAAAEEPPFRINFDALGEAPALEAPEADSIQVENLPDFTNPDQNSFETPDEFQAAPQDMASEDIFDQILMTDLNPPATGEQPVAQPGILYPEKQPALEDQPAEDAGQDEFSIPELTFSTPGEENFPEELQDDLFIATPVHETPEQEAPGEALEKTILFEELPPPESEEALTDEAAPEITFRGDLAEPVSEMLSGEQEPAAEESSTGDIFLQHSWQESAQEETGNESQPEQPEPAAEEPFEEELLDESLIEDMPQPITEDSFIEEPLDESLVEESAGQNAFYPAAGRAEDLFSAQSDASFFDSLQDADGNRDVSAMLKQLVLPADEIEEGMEQFVLFTLGDQTFAAPIANVFELSLPPELIIVPNTPQWILGVCNMRGEIISVVDFKGFLNIEPDSLKKPARMIIVQTRDKQMVIGLMVDSINGIKYFSVDAIQPIEQQEPGLSNAFFQGACLYESEVVIFLDLEQILQSSKMRQFQ